MNTELSANNETQATGLLAVPVLKDGAVIINWHQEEL
jgi:hypothetical protein